MIEKPSFSEPHSKLSLEQSQQFATVLLELLYDIEGADPLGSYLIGMAVEHFSSQGPREEPVTLEQWRH